jgi:CubicO group peptidase (beta-lactamase class C family)
MFGAALIGACLLVTSTARSDVAIPQAPAEQVGVSAKKLERIREVLKSEIDQGKLPGTVVMIARKGKLIYSDALGFQDKSEGKAMSLDSVFRIYSMTKPLVSVAAMMLVEDGKVQLTDPVSKFLPAFKGQRVSVARADPEFARMTYTSVPADREMTVQDLLRHTSGLAYGEITQNAPVKDAYAKAGVYLPGVRDYDSRDITSASRPSASARRRSRTSPAPTGNTACRPTSWAAWSRRPRASASASSSTSGCSSRSAWWTPPFPCRPTRPCAWRSRWRSISPAVSRSRSST